MEEKLFSYWELPKIRKTCISYPRRGVTSKLYTEAGAPKMHRPEGPCRSFRMKPCIKMECWYYSKPLTIFHVAVWKYQTRTQHKDTTISTIPVADFKELDSCYEMLPSTREWTSYHAREVRHDSCLSTCSSVECCLLTRHSTYICKASAKQFVRCPHKILIQNTDHRFHENERNERNLGSVNGKIRFS